MLERCITRGYQPVAGVGHRQRISLTDMSEHVAVTVIVVYLREHAD